jgi:hypothetical protein
MVDNSGTDGNEASRWSATRSSGERKKTFLRIKTKGVGGRLVAPPVGRRGTIAMAAGKNPLTGG